MIQMVRKTRADAGVGILDDVHEGEERTEVLFHGSGELVGGHGDGDVKVDGGGFSVGVGGETERRMRRRRWCGGGWRGGGELGLQGRAPGLVL
jgi:hypothetical protein